MIGISLDLNFECEDCGTPLSITQRGQTICVEFCTTCKDAVENDSWEKGRQVGMKEAAE